MITFGEYDPDLLEDSIKEQSDVYVIKKDDVVIGWGKINHNEDNKIEISILHEYRGNGYGTELFRELLKTFDKSEIIYLTFEDSNIIAKRIVEKFGAKQDSMVNGMIKYVLPIQISIDS